MDVAAIWPSIIRAGDTWTCRIPPARSTHSSSWQSSETRKQIYQDRQTDELRVDATQVRLEIRLGDRADPLVPTPSDGVGAAVDLDALLAALTPSSDLSWRRKSNAEWARNGSQEKIAGTRWDPGDGNRLEIQNFQRAGDGTRTHDVQLGKEAEKQGLSEVRANSPLKT